LYDVELAHLERLQVVKSIVSFKCRVAIPPLSLLLSVIVAFVLLSKIA